MEPDESIKEAAQQVAHALAEGRAMWEEHPFDWPWYISPTTPGCECDVTFHDAQKITMGLRLGCSAHGALARLMVITWNPDQ